MPGGAQIDEEGKFVYANYTCETIDWAEGSIICTPHTAGMPYLEKYFNQDVFHCWSNKSDMGDQVCKSLSGKTTWEYDHADHGHLYTFK